MGKLNGYFGDGANVQAQAVLALLGNFEVQESWNKEINTYEAKPTVARWHNCREQGYVISMHGAGYNRQLNIAFFEHRNTDNICAVKWEETTINPPTIDSEELGKVYKTKYDVSHEVRVGEVMAMAEWIGEQLTNFWVETKEQREAKKVKK
jgi:hypothetical protein